MKKYLCTSWMRVLSSVICTVSVVTMVIAGLGYVMAVEYGGAAEIYKTGYEKVAENYGVYAVDMLEAGEIEKLQKEFAEKKINCSITRISKVPGENEEIITKEDVLFQSGAFGDEEKLEFEVVPKSVHHYHTSSLLGMLYDGASYANTSKSWTDFPIEKVIFDTTSGLFYYETSAGLYVVESVIVQYAEDIIIGDVDILYEEGSTTYENEEMIDVDNTIVYENEGTTYVVEDAYVNGDGFLVKKGETVDYIFSSKNGEKHYVNGYYDAVLDTSNYLSWDHVYIDGWLMDLGNVGSWKNTIEVVSDGSLDLSRLRTQDYEVSGDYISAPYGENLDMYQVEVSCVEEAGGNLFGEWNQVSYILTGFNSVGIPMMIMSFLVFVISFVMMICSAKNNKEQLNFMERLPVFSYSGVLFLIESGFILLIISLVEWFAIRGVRNLFDVVAIVVLLATFATWLAINWFQNMATRIKCKNFWRTSELYYVYKLLKNSWNTIMKPVKWCWAQIKKPFRLIITACKRLGKKISENTSLFAGGLIGFGAIAIVEYFVLYLIWIRNGVSDVFGTFLLLKLLEGAVFFCILFYMKELHEGSKRVASGDMSHPIDTSKMVWKFKEHGENINKVSDGIAVAVEERMKSEHFKTELITNVSHDIKTPLTSIINYVDLIKKEDIKDEKVQEYVDVLDRQSARLKKLIEDLMEASKASTGNLTVNWEECDLDVLLTQVIGEFEERLEKNQLAVVVDKPEHPVKIKADGRHLWRIFDNLLNNACKYSLPGTRVYVILKQSAGTIKITFKNISKEALNIPSEELMERFVRGDSSRNTEGSGLGLSIAQSLTELMKGNMKLDIDGDLFKVTLTFPMMSTK